MKNNSTLFSRIVQSVLDGAQFSILFFGLYTVLKLLNIFVDQNIVENSLLSGVFLALFTFIKLQYLNTKNK